MASPARCEPRGPRANGSTPAELKRRFERGERELFVPLAELARREGRAEDALALLEAGLASWPRRVAAWVELARLKAQLGRIDEALGHYSSILEGMDPRNLPALRALAAAALAAGDGQAARRYLDGWAGEDAEDPELEELREELAALAGEPPAESKAAPRAPGLLELGVAELEPGFLAAPSPRDATAWPAANAQRMGR